MRLSFGEACCNAAQGAFSQPPPRSLEIRKKMEITTSSGATDYFFSSRLCHPYFISFPYSFTLREATKASKDI